VQAVAIFVRFRELSLACLYAVGVPCAGVGSLKRS
jgi:hypothetical protein